MSKPDGTLMEEISSLRAENARLQAVNDQLKAKADALEDESNDRYEALLEAQELVREGCRKLFECQKALDEAREHKAQPDQERRDRYILAILRMHSTGWNETEVVQRADALLAAADGRKP